MAVLLAALVAGAVHTAEASIPPPETWPLLVEEPAASVLQPPSLEDLVAGLVAPEPSPAPSAAAAAGERFQLFEGLQLDLATRSEPRFRLYPRLETSVWAITLSEPLHIELDLPLTASRLRLYGDPPAGIAVGGTFLTADPLGFVDGPNQYQAFRNSPLNHVDPLGLTSRADIADNRLFYTWHLGWIDLSHVETKALVEPWRALKTAQPAESLTVTISLDQAADTRGFERFLTYKASAATFQIVAAEGMETRKRQLLWAWMQVSEQFERHQGTGIQGKQWFNSLGGVFKGQDEKIGSSFSTEDLVSNLVGYYATVEERPWDTILGQLGGRLGAEEQEFSFLVWDCTDFGLKMGGNRLWQPKYLELKPPKAGCERQHDRLVQLYAKYLRMYGKPKFPVELQIVPERRGVETLSQENR